MTAQELLQNGNLTEAIATLTVEVRNNPLDVRRRTFLFELLCFAGEFDRAEKQLDLVADASREAMLGTVLYRAALHAERIRQKMFAERTYPAPRASSIRLVGTRNNTPFEDFFDVDTRIRNSFEVFVAGSYVWISMAQIVSIEVARPKRLRDLLWAPAILTPAPAYRSLELGEVLLPALSPLTYQHHDDAVRLGRATIWIEQDGHEVSFGQKLIRTGEDEIPLLELGKVEFALQAAGESHAVSA